MSGRDNLALLARLSRKVGPGRIDDVLARVELTRAAGRKMGSYSTGMKQRRGLAAALLAGPELLILDEPISGLDPAGMRDMRELERRLADEGVTIFLSSHLLHEVEQVCDRVTVLNSGRVVAQGLVDQLLGGETVVRVAVPNLKVAATLLRDLPGVKEIKVNGELEKILRACSWRWWIMIVLAALVTVGELVVQYVRYVSASTAGSEPMNPEQWTMLRQQMEASSG